MSGFERYNGNESSEDGFPRSKLEASIRKSGGIGLTKATVGAYFCDTDYVELYFNPSNQHVGIKPVDSQTEESYKLTREGNADTRVSSAVIRVPGFLNKHDLNRESTARYEVEWDSENEFIYFDAEDPIEILD